MPATYRVYQTATPRVYDTTRVRLGRNSDWIVRSMDDEEVFGVELYRKSYVESVRNGWLADYRIIAVALNDPNSYDIANELATITESKGRHRRGILKKCVNGQAVYPLSEQHGLKAQERRYTAYGKEKH